MASNEGEVRATISVFTKHGFGVLVTLTPDMTNEEVQDLMDKVAWADAAAINNEFTAAAKGFGGGNGAAKKPYQKPAVQTGDACPKCGEPLIEAETPRGKKMIKCSTAGWDKINKVATGCDYIKWLQ